MQSSPWYGHPIAGEKAFVTCVSLDHVRGHVVHINQIDQSGRDVQYICRIEKVVRLTRAAGPTVVEPASGPATSGAHDCGSGGEPVQNGEAKSGASASGGVAGPSGAERGTGDLVAPDSTQKGGEAGPSGAAERGTGDLVARGSTKKWLLGQSVIDVPNFE